MNILFINKLKLTLIVFLMYTAVFIYIYTYLKFENGVFIGNNFILFLNFLIIFFLIFSPIIFYKSFIKFCSNRIQAEFEDDKIILKHYSLNNDEIALKNEEIIISDLVKYKITEPYSYYISDDFIKIIFYTNTSKYSYCFINKTIDEEMISGIDFINKINNKIQDHNQIKSNYIELLKPFLASEIGKYCLNLFIILFIFFLVISYNENLKQNVISILIFGSSIIKIYARRKSEISRYNKYLN